MGLPRRSPILRASAEKLPLEVVHNPAPIPPLDLPSNSVDVVIAAGAFERVEDKAALLKEAHRVVCPGGRLIFVEPLEDLATSSSRKKLSNDILEILQQPKFLPRPIADHTRNLGRRAGLKIVWNLDWRAGPNIVWKLRQRAGTKIVRVGSKNEWNFVRRAGPIVRNFGQIAGPKYQK